MASIPINFATALARVLELIIVKPFILPFHVYKNALVSLSNSDTPDSEESVLSTDFPLYTWYIQTFDALIAVIYPLGAIAAIIIGTNSFSGGFGSFLIAIATTYFLPLGIGLMRELTQIALKVLLYLKIISKK